MQFLSNRNWQCFAFKDRCSWNGFFSELQRSWNCPLSERHCSGGGTLGKFRKFRLQWKVFCGALRIQLDKIFSLPFFKTISFLDVCNQFLSKRNSQCFGHCSWNCALSKSQYRSNCFRYQRRRSWNCSLSHRQCSWNCVLSKSQYRFNCFRYERQCSWNCSLSHRQCSWNCSLSHRQCSWNCPLSHRQCTWNCSFSECQCSWMYLATVQQCCFQSMLRCLFSWHVCFAKHEFELLR